MENVVDKTKKKKNTESQSHELNTDRAESPKPLKSPLWSSLKILKDEAKAKLKVIDEDELKSQRKGSLQEHVVLEGNLSVHSQTFLKHEKEKVHYFRLFPASKFGRARLQQNASAETSANKFEVPELVLLSSDIIKIEDLDGSNSDDDKQPTFLVQSKEHALVLSASNEMEKHQWIAAIQEILLSDCDSPTRKTAHHRGSTENISLPRAFHVRISKKTQVRIGDDSPVDLVVDFGSVTAIASNKVRLVKWPLSLLRKYGFTNTTFYVEAGRNSEAGEGEYEFVTEEGEDIHRAVKAAKRSHVTEGEHVRGLPSSPSPPSFSCNTYADDIYQPVNPTLPRYAPAPSKPSSSTNLRRNELKAPPLAVQKVTSSGSSSSQHSQPYEYDSKHRKTFNGVLPMLAPVVQDNAQLFLSSKSGISKSVTAFPIHPRKVPIVDSTYDESTEVSVPAAQSQKNVTGLQKSPIRLHNSITQSLIAGVSKPKPTLPQKPSVESLQSTIIHQEINEAESELDMNNGTSEQHTCIYAMVDEESIGCVSFVAFKRNSRNFARMLAAAPDVNGS